MDFCADGSYPASVGVNDTAAHCDASGEAKLVGCFFAEKSD